MPRLKKKLDPVTPEPVKDSAPASPQVRDAIKKMSGFSNEAELSEAIPESTAVNTEAEVPRRKRRTKAEMAASRGETPDSSLETDERYRLATQRMAAFGGAKTIKTAFAATGKPLDVAEDSDVDDYFYVISRKYGLDASKSGIFLAIYAILLMLRLVIVRLMNVNTFDLWSSFEGIFSGKKDVEKEEDPEETETEQKIA